MNRRGILKALGFGAAAMPTIGPKQAASIVGLDTAMGMPLARSVEACSAASGPTAASYWESPLRIAIEANQFSRHDADHSYGHMKSWSASYKRMAAARDYAAMQLLQQRLQQDDGLRDKIARALLGGVSS